MGYCIEQTDSSFTIKKENWDDAFKAVKFQLAVKTYQWVGTDWFNGLRDIYSILEFWGYQPEFNQDTGDITGINFDRDKLGDEFELFKVIAPFVEAGSFIEMVGEDHISWRWNFNGTTCTEDYL